jgi:hypothetical protein
MALSLARLASPEPMVSREPMGPEGMPGLEAMADREAPVAMVTPASMAKTPPLAEQVERLEMAALAEPEVLEPALRPMEPTAMAEMAVLEDLAAVVASEGLESMAPMEHWRVPLAAQVAMGATGPMAAQVEPVGSVVWLEDSERLPEPMDSAATVAQADRPEPQETAAMEGQAMRCLPMAATAATEAPPVVWLDWAESEERRADLEPLRVQMARMGPSQPAVEMEGMAGQVSALLRPARLEAMVVAGEMEVRMAMAARVEPVAMAR